MITNSSIGTLGRLGNQLFQFAFLYGQCTAQGRRAFMNRDQYGFDLRHFQVEHNDIVRLARRSEFEQLFENEIVANWPERTWRYSDDIAVGADGCDYSGYFQSPRYFDHCADDIRAAIRLKRPLKPAASHWTTFIEESSVPVVGVHVRLGDYLQFSHAHTNLQKTDYYERALMELRQSLQRPFVTLVFSDDIEWCESSGLFAEWNDVRFVSGLGHTNDFSIMSRCHHHVVANSSFSWWGAWLAGRGDHIVVAPKQWFGPGGIPQWDTIYPAGWKIIDSHAFDSKS